MNEKNDIINQAPINLNENEISKVLNLTVKIKIKGLNDNINIVKGNIFTIIKEENLLLCIYIKIKLYKIKY